MAEQGLTIDLSAPARLADLPSLAHAFLAWWGSELFALLPARLRALFPRPKRSAFLFAESDRWRIVSGLDNAQSIEIDASGSDSSIAGQILQSAPDFALSRLTVVLPRDRALRRRLELPLMPEDGVRDAVTLQVDRLSPFKAGAVRVATRVVARHMIEGKLDADVVFAPHAPIEALEARLQALGLQPIAVDIESENGDPAGFDLRQQQRKPANRRALALNTAVAVGAVLSWVLASYALDVARERELNAWRDRVAELRPVAQRAADLRRRIEAMIEPIAMARAHDPAQSLTLMTELTNILPDDARLVELRFSPDAVELIGVAGNAPALIGKLESSKQLSTVRFRAPVTRWQGTPLDRFEITAKRETKTR